jgi:hypothetical protein
MANSRRSRMTFFLAACKEPFNKTFVIKDKFAKDILILTFFSYENKKIFLAFVDIFQEVILTT